MTKDTLFMGTTEVSAEKSAAEITSLLVCAGASQIATDYKAGKIAGLRFTLQVSGQTLAFELPARTEPVYKLLLSRTRKSWFSDKEKEQKRAQAERIGWRQLFRWTQAQLAMIDAGMVSAHEVFLPYLLLGQRTMLRTFEEDTLRLLSAPERAQ